MCAKLGGAIRVDSPTSGLADATFHRDYSDQRGIPKNRRYSQRPDAHLPAGSVAVTCCLAQTSLFAPDTVTRLRQVMMKSTVESCNAAALWNRCSQRAERSIGHVYLARTYWAAVVSGRS